ncbi:MAG: NAD(P)H-hydrate dehydratase [Bacillota bacterium]|nr:MAG: NAD(P)H-hydrate dehydratase [Bacillota bacterium]
MWLLGAEATRRADRAAMEAGLSGPVLMETAGRTAAAVLLALAGAPDPRRPVVVLAGGGNNGGDGMVLARWLARWAGPAAVRVYLLADPDRLRGEAAIQWWLLRREGVPVRWRGGDGPAGRAGVQPAPNGGAGGTGDGAAPGEDDFLAALRADAARALVAVDALLGVGARGPLRPPAAAALRALAAGGAPVLALDLPSGLDPDTGEAAPETPRATWTVTFGVPKWGLVLRDGPERAGEVLVADIGWPEAPVPPAGGDGGEPPAARVIDPVLARELVPRRPPGAHKGTAGHVTVIGGRAGQAGAPLLAARAALRAGAGTVTVAVPASVRPEVAAQEAALMTYPLPDREGEVDKGAAEAVAALEAGRPARRARVIGPGLGQGRDAAHCLMAWLGGAGPGEVPPTVLDADGLNLVAAAGVERLRHRPGPFPLVLTPHPGEAARLLGCGTGEVQADRPRAALRLAERSGAVVVLKGYGTLVADPHGRLYFCSRGNPGMATAGMGDALAGVIGALLAQGLEPVEAAVLGVYLHALAGDLAAAAAGAPPAGRAAAGWPGAFARLTVGDVIEQLPTAIAWCAQGLPSGTGVAPGPVPGVVWLRPPVATGRQPLRGGER